MKNFETLIYDTLNGAFYTRKAFIKTMMKDISDWPIETRDDFNDYLNDNFTAFDVFCSNEENKSTIILEFLNYFVDNMSCTDLGDDFVLFKKPAVIEDED